LNGLNLAIFAIFLSIVGCNRPGDPNRPAGTSAADSSASNSLVSENMPEKLKNIVKTTNTAKSDRAPKIVGFSFVPPSPDWIEAEPTIGDGTYTKAAFKSKSMPIQLAITSIGLPLNGNNAKNLVKNCETEFAVGISKHPEMTKEWIRSGFSISRYADSGKREVSVWCISEYCKVQLKFSNLTSSKLSDDVKVADVATDAFFEQNPSGGAKKN
jgi:hypothetical protein